MTQGLLRRPTGRRRFLGRFLQLVVVAVLVVGLSTRNVAVVVNAVLGLGVTFLPSILQRDLGVPLDPRFGLLVTLAICLHTVGMVGPYETTWWWDHVTHALSAIIVAIVGYTATRAFDEYSDSVYFPPRFLAVFVFLFVVALGVVWEILEFAARGLAYLVGVAPVLVQYGLPDTMMDLVFDMAGAVVVGLFGTRWLQGMVASYVAWFDQRIGEDGSE